MSLREENLEISRKTDKIFRPVLYIGILAVIILNVVLLFTLIPLRDHYENALGDFPSPLVLNRVPGHQGPTARIGDITVLSQDRCVNRDTNIEVTTIWTPETVGSGGSQSNTKPLKQHAMKGCATITMALAMPERVNVGKWYIQGIVRDEPSGDVKYWTSEIFIVVAATP